MAINELILTTIAGIVAVSVIGFLFIPHWTAVLFVTPLITTLYIDLLGKWSHVTEKDRFIQYCGNHGIANTVAFLLHLTL